VFRLIVFFTFWFWRAGAFELTTTPILSAGVHRLRAQTPAAVDREWGGLTLGLGGLGYLDLDFKNLHARFGAMLETRGFSAETAAGQVDYAQTVLTAPVGVSYRIANYFWPFFGVAVDWSIRSECTLNSSDCGDNSLKSFQVPG